MTAARDAAMSMSGWGGGRKWFRLAARAVLAGCIGGGVLFLMTLVIAVPDCTPRVQAEKGWIFTSGALTAATWGLLLAIRQRGRMWSYGIMTAASVLFCHLAVLVCRRDE
jgi:hypothetical protein